MSTRNGIFLFSCSPRDGDELDVLGEAEEDSTVVNQVQALLINQCLLQSNAFFTISPRDSGDGFFNGGNEGKEEVLP